MPSSADPAVVAIAGKAQRRLYDRFSRLAIRRPCSVANVAVARELAGFLWAALATTNRPCIRPATPTLTMPPGQEPGTIGEPTLALCDSHLLKSKSND